MVYKFSHVQDAHKGVAIPLQQNQAYLFHA